MGNKFGWHSGTLKCKNAEILGDLTINDDLIFSDVSAGTLGVTGGIDMSGTTSAVGIDLSGGTFSTGSIRLGDDDKLLFGAGNDASFEYDEDGTDNLRYDGADMIFDAATKLLFRDSDLSINSSADGQLDIVADTRIAINGFLSLETNSGADSANGLLIGIGTSGSPSTTSTADKSFMEFRTQSTATSGDSRCLYMRHDLNGAGVSGESLRSFTKITAAAATARGAHISLDVASAGSCSGLGVGVDSQILVHDGALSGGTYAVQNLEAYSAGSSTDVSGVTAFDIIRVSLGGDTTGAATVDAKANLFNFSGVTAGSGNLINTDITTHTAYGGIPINIAGTVKYIALVSD